MSAFAEVSQLVSEFTEQKRQLAEVLKTKLNGVFAEFFETHPDVKVLGWLQYTPYFNDGEACMFSVHDLHASKVDYDPDEHGSIDGFLDEHCEYFSSYSQNKSFSDETNKAARELSDFLQSEDLSDFMQAAFDDHVTVMVTYDSDAKKVNIEVEEYEHD
jgi:hypothetical protein